MWQTSQCVPSKMQCKNPLFSTDKSKSSPERLVESSWTSCFIIAQGVWTRGGSTKIYCCFFFRHFHPANSVSQLLKVLLNLVGGECRQATFTSSNITQLLHHSFTPFSDEPKQREKRLFNLNVKSGNTVAFCQLDGQILQCLCNRYQNLQKRMLFSFLLSYPYIGLNLDLWPRSAHARTCVWVYIYWTTCRYFRI